LNAAGQPIVELELRHRLRARAEDRIRAARVAGLRNLPFQDTAQSRIWLEMVQIAVDLLAWMPMLALTGKARFWARRLRFRLFAAGQLISPRPSADSPPRPPPALAGEASEIEVSCFTKRLRLRCELLHETCDSRPVR
jgi:hypothetical protein